MTGARRGNLLAMRWPEIDFDEAVWHIRRTKGNKPQVIPLAGPVVKILERRSEGASGERVFPGAVPGEHVTESRTAWKRLLEGAGITNIRQHGVRRTLGSW